jgi:F-type H+-transporting ATPase subunit epsilon
VNASGLTVLAEFAVSVDELDSGEIQKEIEAAEMRLAEAKEGHARDKAAERVDQLKQVRAQLGAVTQAAH